MTLPSGRSACRLGRARVSACVLDEGTGTFCEGACTGNTIVFAPPPNQDDVATLTIEMFKTLFSGNLDNVRIFKLADDGTTVTELFDCPWPTALRGSLRERAGSHPGRERAVHDPGRLGDPGFGTR